MSKKPILKLGPVDITEGEATPTRFALMIWGPAGCGKTTFAATAPGKKLWVSLGDNEHVSVMHRDDVMIADMSGLSYQELFKHMQNDDPFGLDKVLSENEDIETVVVDSATALAFRALQQSVIEKRTGAGRGFNPTMEMPGISAYGGRNAIVLECVTGLLRVTNKHNVHFIITAHEDDPTMVPDGKGNEIIDHIGIQLGGKLVNNMTWRLSEIWHLRQSDIGEKQRMMNVRPTRLRRPMKTRMFSSMGPAEFTVTYDAEKPDKGQETIAAWYDRWLDNDKQKIEVPKASVTKAK